MSRVARAKPRQRRRLTDEGGEAVEFILVSVLVVFVVLALLQLALVLHVRNTLISCAAEGAHLAAAGDRSLAEGEARAEQLAAGSFGGYPVEAEASATIVDGAPVVEVTMTAPVPIVGLWGFGTLRVEAHAIEEADRG